MDAFYSESVQLVSSISSDESLTESCNGFILKENLTKAVNLGNHGALVDFAWGSKMFAEKISLKELKLKERDESFQIPVTLNNIGTLNEMSQCRSLKHTWEIDASKVCSSTLENLNLSSLVVHNLQLPMEMKITTKFSKLILYNGGNGFIHSLGSCCAEGKFGTATLQVPVEGGHEGGNLNVEYEGRKKRLESHETSDAIFYLTAFYDSCEHFIEPISRGYKLVLVYDLLWTNATNEIPRNFPVFLGALKQIKESLHPWRNRYKLLKSTMNNEKPQNLVEETKEPTVAASEVQDSTEPMKSFKNEENVLFGEKTIQENVFLFVLQESYEENILSFLLLQGQDRVFADILLNCDFLDVHLANATQSGFEVQQGKVDVIEISRVIDSDDITRNLSIKLQWDKNFAGLIPSDPKKILEEDTSEDNIEVGKRNLNRGVLLIWPKYLSVQMYCRYGLHSLLVRIAKSLKSTARSNEEARTKTLPDLRQLISYCCAEPREVWKKSGMKKGEVTQRLFDFCISLRAREEGLHLLKNLALNFDQDSQDTEEFEGIQTEDVALTIAKFEHQVCGWNMIAETIRALVKQNRIAKQLIPITKLAKNFLRFHCFDGAKTVGDCISSLYAEMDPSLAWQSKCFDVEAVIDMLVALESNPETSSRKRVKSFALFFSNLRPSLQCHLLLNFESQHGFRLRTIPSWQFIYQDVCAIFSESSNTSPPPLKCMAFDFMNGIQIWLSKLREEANLRPELRDSVEPNVDATDPVLEHTAAVSLSQKSNNPLVELKAGKGGSTTDWIAASDEWDSTTSTLIAVASQTKANAGTLSTDDWCEKTNSQSTNSNEKEASPCVSKSTNDWDACADAWASSSGKTPRNEVKAVTNVDQSSWGATRKLPASSNSKTPSDDWDSWSTTSNSTAPKSNIVPISGGNDDWSTSADAWGASKGTNAGSNQSDGWGSTETVKSSWTSGYNASRDGRGSERKPLRPCFKCNEEGHMSYNCPTNPNRGRGGGRGSGRGGGTRVCFKCNEEGHMSYDCPTGPTRGRGGGRGGGSTRPCYKCNQEGHTSYNCPTASRGGIRSSPASGYGATNSSTSQPVFDDWGTLTATSGTKSSSCDSGDKKDDWGSSSGTVSSPWANDSNAAARGGRSTPRSSAPFRDSQPVVDDWGISSNPSTVPIIKTVSHTTTGNSGSDDWDAAADAWSAIDTTKSTPLSGNLSAVKVGGDDWGTAKSSSSIDTTKFSQKSGNSSAAKAGGDDWGSAADAWSSVNTSSSNPRSGKSSIAKAGGLNCSVVDDSWDKCPSASNSEQGQLNITRNRPNSIVKPDEDDWGRSADVSKRDLVSSATANSRLPPMDDGNVNGFEKRNDQNISSYRELNQSIVNAIAWNGTINHGHRSFKTSMKNVDVNPPPVPADFEMPKSMRVMGTIEPEKVWTYLKRVKQTTNESIGVFEFSPATTAEVDGYKFFFDEFHENNWFAVIADAPGSKLPCCFKDFYVVPLAKDSVVPLELTSLVKKSSFEQRTSDLFLGVVVFRVRRFVDKSNLNPSLPEKTSVPDTQSKMESESNKIQEANSSEPSQVASAHPPTRMAAIRQKLQQDILSVDPVKAKVHANSPHLSSKSPSSRHPSVTKSHLSVSPKESPLVAESREGKMAAINVPFIPDKPVDGEMLMQKAILEELSRQIGATKHGKSTEVGSSSPSHKTESYSTGSLSGVEPPFTRSKSKRKSIDEESSLSKRPKQIVSSKNSNLPVALKEKVKLETEIVQLKARTSSRRSSNASPPGRLQCVIEGCSSDAQTNSVYCSDECIAKHVRDSLHAMSEKIKSSQLQEPQSPIDSLTPPGTSSDESLWKDSVDYTLLMNQPTPALASKLLAITQRRKSLSSNPPNLAGDTPIPVIETKTGKVLRGPSAPNVANVEQWLKENATYTIMKPESPSIQPLALIPDTPSMTSSSNVADSSPIPPSSTPPTASSLKSKGDGLCSKKSSDLSSSKSKVTRKRSTETNKEEETPTKMAKSDPESTRSFSRNSLKDALWSRCKEANDLELDESIVEQVATEIEDSLFSFFKKDVGSKYKNKYRSLIYNIKDPKNPGLFREIITKQINPGELVKMSTEDLAYKDLAEWRENEAKRQLDLIEKNEQENMGLSNRYLIKTHKGEEIIENVCKEVADGEEISVKIEIALPELANDMTPKYKSQRIAERSRSSLSSSHSIKEKDRNNSSSSRSSREKVSSRSSKSSRRHSDSASKRSDHHRSDRDKKKDTKERDHHHRSSKRRDEHHYNSDRDKKREKERKKDIPEQTKSSSNKKVVVDEKLYDPSQPLNSDDDVPIPAAFEDELALQQKLSKQQAVLEELNHQNQTSSYTQRVAESAIVNSAVSLLPKADETGLSKIAVTTSLRKASRSEERQYRLLTDYSDDENVEKPEETVALDVDMNRHHDLVMESDPAVGTVRSFNAQDEANPFYSPGNLLIAEDEEPIIDFEEQILKEQVVIEELNSNLTSFIVNNLHIESHDTELDANTSSEIVTSDVKEPDVPDTIEHSTSTAICCMDTSSVNSSADPVFDQSTQSTSSSHLEDPITTTEQEEH